ncbi:MAG TPA: aminotransferase class III-fold pyridoxal phosphate-dependent enzyme, partial [Arthrobacter sp.]|nr:aminotransferase class III-fold pyridoxal phosphate-dependent enzyme [Arthrobacter sp.]
LLDDGRWRTDVARVGAGLAAGLSPALKLDAVTDVRTIGAVGVIELRDAVDVAAVTRAAVENGVWVRPFRNLVYAMPPYISSASQVAAMAAGMVAAVAAADRTVAA